MLVYKQADAFEVVMSNEKYAQKSDDVLERQASFQDRNNNRVGYGYQITHPGRNAPQLCSAMRAKVFHARKITFASGADRVDNPPANRQVRLIYKYNNDPELPRSASAFPGSHPCRYAFSKVDR